MLVHSKKYEFAPSAMWHSAAWQNVLWQNATQADVRFESTELWAQVKMEPDVPLLDAVVGGQARISSNAPRRGQSSLRAPQRTGSATGVKLPFVSRHCLVSG